MTSLLKGLSAGYGEEQFFTVTTEYCWSVNRNHEQALVVAMPTFT